MSHAVHERISLALHREIARRLRADPSGVDHARARMAAWGDQMHPFYADKWAALLDGPLPALLARLEADDEDANDLRQNSPFAGWLDDRTRFRLLREAREG